jgi:hypothetical protein
MENIPDYDTWKGRSSEDDAEMHERRSSNDSWRRRLVDDNADAPVHVDKRDALIKELVEALKCISDDIEFEGDHSIRFVDFGGTWKRESYEKVLAAIEKAREHGYVD